MSAFEQKRCDALRREIHVFFGEEAYQACTTTEACLAQLSKKDEDAITPFLQVFNLWRRHREIKELVFNKVSRPALGGLDLSFVSGMSFAICSIFAALM
jgi:hypothetical protein